MRLIQLLLYVSLLTMALFVFMACDVYDETLISTNDNGEKYEATEATQNDEGKNRQVTAGGSTTSVQADGGGHIGNESDIDRDSVEVCGDGKVTGTESCDVGISLPNPGACLFPCLPIPPCFNAVLEGSSCHATRCLFSRVVACESGDGCCPENCTFLTDSDCSESCGDGVVQPNQGETCEPSNSDRYGVIPDAKDICPQECPDDGDPCTVELLSGSPEKCNVKCTRSTITYAVNDDGCCPKGADSNRDSDCESVCGNGIREGNEECDGDKGCDSRCRSLLAPEYRACINHNYFRESKVEEECSFCLCETCTNEIEACYMGASQYAAEKCKEIVECALLSRCVNIECYCGAYLSRSLSSCSYERATGACKEVIAQAAGTTDIVSLLAQAIDPSTIVGRAMALDYCFETSCRNVCYPDDFGQGR